MAREPLMDSSVLERLRDTPKLSPERGSGKAWQYMCLCSFMLFKVFTVFPHIVSLNSHDIMW